MEAATETATTADTQIQEEPEEPKNETEEEKLLNKAQELMNKVTSSRANPSPMVLHALAAMLETQESRYIEELGHSSPNNGRSSHNIGKLSNLIRENEEFFELTSSEFLTDTRFSTSVRAAAARLLLSCSTTWVYPHVFEDNVVESIKNWVLGEYLRLSVDESDRKHALERNKPADSEMLGTYATGLLAICLAGGGQIVEDVLTSGLPAKLMRYLRMRVLGETSSSKQDVIYPVESKIASGSHRGKEESRSRFRQVLDSSHIDGPRIGDEGILTNHSVDREHDRSIGRKQAFVDRWVNDGESLESREVVEDLSGGDTTYEANEDDVEYVVEDRWRNQDLHEDKANHRAAKTRGRGRVEEGTVESDRMLTSPGSGIRLGVQGRHNRDINSPRNSDAKKEVDSKKWSDAFSTIREDTDECFEECKVGTRDISDLVMKATRAAEAEARTANAPPEAVKAAGDAAADLVKSAALEAYKSTNDEEAGVLAASKAASTVIDAANATEVSRSSINLNEDLTGSSAKEPESEEVEGCCVLDNDSLVQLREKYCIQCLEVLGEYVEVLGPVLHEKGVDVCLALLQRNSEHKDVTKVMMLLPEVLKLICALAAHRKFAALFVDRGGMQKLLAVPRVGHTFFGLSSCLFIIGSLQGIMERVCALPSDIVYKVVGLALQLIECTQDLARKNAAIFFAAAFVFRAIIDAFDAQEGLKKLLNLLHGAASVRSGGNSGTMGVSNMGSLRNDRSPAEVLTASEKQVAYHTCVALRQYFRAHLLLLVESLRPNKSQRSVGRNIPSSRAAYKPLDISNEAIDSVFLQIQRDRKLCTAFVRARWPAVDNFLAFNGHITMLELCQAPPVERYLHELAQYALGVLHIVTLVPYSRKLIVTATLSSDRVGMAVILDASNVAGVVDPEVIQPALNVLVNLVCPPPSISNKPHVLAQGQQSIPAQTPNGPVTESRERHPERSISERNGETSVGEQSHSAITGAPFTNSSSQTVVPTINSGVVGDRRISLGPGAGFAGIAAQLEQGYRQAREAVRANNGIKVLLHLLHPRIPTPTTALDCLRALACRILLGLARDDAIAHILTKLQVGKKLSELIRDSGSPTPGSEQGRWQAELSQVAIELISIVTNSGRSSTLAATDAAAPTLRRIERAAIAAATPITYSSKELLLLIHEHLKASGLNTAADSLLKEAELTPLPPLAAPLPLLHQTSLQEAPAMQFQWPSGRAPNGFLSDASTPATREEESLKSDSVAPSSKKKPLSFSSTRSFKARNQPVSQSSSGNKLCSASKTPIASDGVPEAPAASVDNLDTEPQFKTPIVLPLKRKLTESKDGGFTTPAKRLATGEHGFRSPVSHTPGAVRKNNLPGDTIGFPHTPISGRRDIYGRSTPSCIPSDNLDDNQYCSTPAGQMTPAFQHGLQAEMQQGNSERVTLDSLIVQYLKHQHRQCPAPITTLPPLSLLHPHMCPEPRRSLDLPTNVTSRLSTREFKMQYGGIHGNRRDRQFIYSRFKPLRTCRDDAALLTCIAFLGDSSRIVTGGHSGELKIFESESGNLLESHTGHQSPLTVIQSALSGDTQLVLSSGSHDVRLWDASTFATGPMHSLEGCKAAQFSNSKTMFAALSTESSRREVLLYDIQTWNLELKLSDPSIGAGSGRGHVQSLVHFSPSDTMLLWNGVLWDRRVTGPVHRFDLFTDYGGGGFHPAGNEVIISSEVWDLRKFKLVRQVPSLEQTVIKFNTTGDVIYATLRRNLDDITTAINAKRLRHPLFAAFRTIDAINYTDIATVPVDRCILDFATEPTDSVVGLVAMDDHDEMFSSARLYEIGRRRPTDDDSDPDDAESEDDDGEDDDSGADEDPLLGPDLDGDLDSDADDMSNDDDDSVDGLEDDDDDDDGEDGDFGMDDVDFDGGVLEIVSDGDEDDDSEMMGSFSSGDEEDFGGNGFGF